MDRGQLIAIMGLVFIGGAGVTFLFLHKTWPGRITGIVMACLFVLNAPLEGTGGVTLGQIMSRAVGYPIPGQ